MINFLWSHCCACQHPCNFFVIKHNGSTMDAIVQFRFRQCFDYNVSCELMCPAVSMLHFSAPTMTTLLEESSNANFKNFAAWSILWGITAQDNYFSEFKSSKLPGKSERVPIWKEKKDACCWFRCSATETAKTLLVLHWKETVFVADKLQLLSIISELERKLLLWFLPTMQQRSCLGHQQIVGTHVILTKMIFTDFIALQVKISLSVAHVMRAMLGQKTRETKIGAFGTCGGKAWSTECSLSCWEWQLEPECGRNSMEKGKQMNCCVPSNNENKGIHSMSMGTMACITMKENRSSLSLQSINFSLLHLHMTKGLAMWKKIMHWMTIALSEKFGLKFSNCKVCRRQTGCQHSLNFSNADLRHVVAIPHHMFLQNFWNSRLLKLSPQEAIQLFLKEQSASEECVPEGMWSLFDSFLDSSWECLNFCLDFVESIGVIARRAVLKKKKGPSACQQMRHPANANRDGNKQWLWGQWWQLTSEFCQQAKLQMHWESLQNKNVVNHNRTGSWEKW